MEIAADRLLWDVWNLAHIADHGMTRADVEQVCAGPHAVAPSYRSRLVLVGPRADGRLLAVVLEREPSGFYYCVSARPASRRERRQHRAYLEGTVS